MSGISSTNHYPFNETELLLRLKKGDTNAYLEIYNKYHPALYSYILRFLKIPELAEDVLQEVFLKLWEVRERIDPTQSFNAYLYKISRNSVLKSLKKIATEDELRIQVSHHMHAAVEEADIKLQWQQYQQFLHAAIGQLPPQRQKVFILCRHESKKYEEVAAELGISRNTVKEHMVLAAKFLKEYFHRHYKIDLILILFILFTK